MTAPDSRPARAPGMSGRAQARSAIPRTSAGLTAIGVLPVPSVARLSPVSSVASSPHHEVTRRADPIGSPKGGAAFPARAAPAMRSCRSRGLAAVAWGGAGDECTAALQHDQPSLSG